MKSASWYSLARPCHITEHFKTLQFVLNQEYCRNVTPFTRFKKNLLIKIKEIKDLLLINFAHAVNF